MSSQAPKELPVLAPLDLKVEEGRAEPTTRMHIAAFGSGAPRNLQQNGWQVTAAPQQNTLIKRAPEDPDSLPARVELSDPSGHVSHHGTRQEGLSRHFVLIKESGGIFMYPIKHWYQFRNTTGVRRPQAGAAKGDVDIGKLNLDDYWKRRQIAAAKALGPKAETKPEVKQEAGRDAARDAGLGSSSDDDDFMERKPKVAPPQRRDVEALHNIAAGTTDEFQRERQREDYDIHDDDGARPEDALDWDFEGAPSDDDVEIHRGEYEERKKAMAELVGREASEESSIEGAPDSEEEDDGDGEEGGGEAGAEEEEGGVIGGGDSGDEGDAEEEERAEEARAKQMPAIAKRPREEDGSPAHEQPKRPRPSGAAGAGEPQLTLEAFVRVVTERPGAKLLEVYAALGMTKEQVQERKPEVMQLVKKVLKSKQVSRKDGKYYPGSTGPG
ncbi:unnamed protein product [Pedinophyceae sp. YPF-701]|nr:unnamed protein product [Pedinophyceae sp. YPF-701]